MYVFSDESSNNKSPRSWMLDESWFTQQGLCGSLTSTNSGSFAYVRSFEMEHYQT
jgi:hypothetical protein